MEKEKSGRKHVVGRVVASCFHEISVPVFAFADVLGLREGQVVPVRMDQRQKGFVKGGHKD